MSGSPMSSTTASGTLAVDLRQRAGSALGQTDLVAGQGEGAPEHLPQRSIVVHDEQSHVVIVVAWRGAARAFPTKGSYVLRTHCSPAGRPRGSR